MMWEPEFQHVIGDGMNTLICDDNVNALAKLERESVDLVYADPPFFSHKHYEVIWGDDAEIRSFEDRWEGGIEHYIAWMEPRVQLIWEVLKPTGTFYLHCDHHANAYLRILLDRVFGRPNFRNEIIWCYRGAGYPKRDFGRRHDTIFRFSKTDKYCFNLDDVREDYAEATKERFSHYIGNVRKSGDFGPQRLNPLGKQPDDWWQIQPIAPSAKERLGYPTQKPEALLAKIVKASSAKGDLILDPFCGCGTALAVAQNLGRRWIGIDISPTAIKAVKGRFSTIGMVEAKDYVVVGMPTTIEELKRITPIEFQNWVIDEMRARHSRKKVGDMGLDGYMLKDLYHPAAGIQVKQQEHVGRPEIDSFETALRRAKYQRGYFVAFDFGRGAHEEVARLANDPRPDQRLKITLLKAGDILTKKAVLG